MWTIQDFVFLKQGGIHIDEETFVQVREEENTHRNFTTCPGCCAMTFSQHQPSCSRASVLFLPNWFETVQARAAKAHLPVSWGFIEN
jgi:hypothetical protein